MKVSVSVTPQAKQDKVVQLSENVFKISTTQPPERDKANRAVQVLLAKHLNLRKSQVYLVAGSKSKDKVFEVLTY